MNLLTQLSHLISTHREKFGFYPALMYMNAHTREELAEEIGACDETRGDETYFWLSSIPIRLDPTMTDHDVMLESPDREREEVMGA